MSATDPSDDEDSRWGASKADYYGADTIETEQDAQMEEAESKRLQQKQLRGMTEADFGFDEDAFLSEEEGDDEDAQKALSLQRKGTFVERLPQLHITSDTSPQKQLQMMYERYPEFEHLTAEFIELQPLHDELAATVTKRQTHADAGQRNSKKTSPGHAVQVLKYQALSAYMASLSTYFALLSSPKKRDSETGIPIAPQELRKHPIMDYLLAGREMWQKVRHLDVPGHSDETSSDTEMPLIEIPTATTSDLVEAPLVAERKRKRKVSKMQRAAEAAAAEAESQRQLRILQTQKDLAGLSALLDEPSRSKTSKHVKAEAPIDPDDSDFGEEVLLTAEEAAEKARRKKSLRFYTSQIAQKANMRGSKGRATGGDDDLPYRERLKDRQARLNEQAEKRGRKAGEAREKLGGDSDDNDHQIAKEVRRDQASDDDDDYYDMVAARVSKKKADNKERAEAYATAKAQNARVVEKEELGPDGKRKISYAIEKNKGMTPFRKKDVRNPRVKKRKKFEEKKKKLGSIKQVWKGGEGKGGYGGERTGIKSGLVRSVKL